MVAKLHKVRQLFEAELELNDDVYKCGQKTDRYYFARNLKVSMENKS